MLEILIAIAIVAILTALAVPTYLDYMLQSRYSQVIAAADSYKAGVAACILNNAGTFTSCDAGEKGIKSALTTGSGYLAAIAVADGVITATATATEGLSGETYVLTPSYTAGKVTWAASGTSCTAGLAAC